MMSLSLRPALSLLAASGLTLALPAAAQPQGWPSIHQRQGAFERRLDEAYYSGAVPRDEANRLHATLEELLRPVKGPREAVRNTRFRTSTWEKKQ